MDDLSKVIGRLVAFLRFCCSFNGMDNVTEGHAHFSINCRLVAGMPAETSQRPSGVPFSSPRILIVCSGTVHIRSSAMEMSRMLFVTSLHHTTEGYRQKMWVEDGHVTKGNEMIACLTHA